MAEKGKPKTIRQNLNRSQVGEACDASQPFEYCISGQYWAFCDPKYGLQYFDCGTGQCQTNLNGGVSGSCTCGATNTTFPALGSSGLCLQLTLSTGGTSLPSEYVFTCAGSRTYQSNCRGATGLESGRCWTLVGAPGSSSSCKCDQCSDYDARKKVCSPSCVDRDIGVNLTCRTGGTTFPFTYSCQ